jgi:voltage-gated potassium channel
MHPSPEPLRIEPAARRNIVMTVVRTLVIVTGLITAYYLAPLTGGSTLGIVLRSLGGFAIVVALLLWEVRMLLYTDEPARRIVPGLLFLVPLVIIVFAMTYLLLSHEDPRSFNEHLDHTGSLYFAMTTITTIGYGDIRPVSEPARIIVMVQMLAGFSILAIVSRLVVASIREARARVAPDDDRRVNQQ